LLLGGLVSVILVGTDGLVASNRRPALAQDKPLPPEIQAVRKHILEVDYPERFLASVYQARIEQALLADLDRDGRAEVVVLLRPHYRQSAPIVIYRVSKDLVVTRVREGLAPGPLVPVSGAYLDSHALGEAVDFTIGARNGPLEREKALAALGQSRFGGAVEYGSFFHADGRAGDLAYIDMRHAAVPRGQETCREFEFSRVEAMAAGALESEPTTVHLAARVGGELWLYHVAEFLPNGLLRKTVRVVRLPADFERFAPGPLLRYQTRSGEVRSLAVSAR
jgi:hypothetical protein